MTYLESLPKGGAPFDPYFVPEDWARLQYGRLLWKRPHVRARLLRHWSDQRHPYRERFLGTYQAWVEEVLDADPRDDGKLDRELREAGQSLRSIMREIPPVFGSFY